MVKTSFSDANIINIFSGGSLLPGHTVICQNRWQQILELIIVIAINYHVNHTIISSIILVVADFGILYNYSLFSGSQ